MEPLLGTKCWSIYLAAVLLCCTYAQKESKTLKAREGTNVTLMTGDGPAAQVVWTFGPEIPKVTIATTNGGKVKSDYNEHFKDKLHLDRQTSLTITALTASDSGIYQFQSISRSLRILDFHLRVYSCVSDPSITLSPSAINRSSSSLTAECTVSNSRDLVLSWYKGNDKLKHINGSRLPSVLTLSLEIDYGDKENYTCVAENPVEKRSTPFIHQKHAENNGNCQTEIAIRLVLSAIIAVVLILLLVDHFILG